ncbi:MAG: FAD binding domain-containing protein, partial [Anaerolineales bacterium]
MKPPPFKYLAPDSLEQALELMAQYGEEAKLLAGGQSLIPAMNFRVAQP